MNSAVFNSATFNAPPFYAPPPFVAPGLIRQAVASALLAAPSVAAIVGTSVFPGVVPEQTDLPAVTFSVISHPRGQNLGGPDGTARARFQFSALSRDSDQCEALSVAITGFFDGFAGNLADLADVIETTQQSDADNVDNPTDGSNQGIYRLNVDFSFQYRTPPRS